LARALFTRRFGSPPHLRTTTVGVVRLRMMKLCAVVVPFGVSSSSRAVLAFGGLCLVSLRCGNFSHHHIAWARASVF
jgi:hypothetical protein